MKYIAEFIIKGRLTFEVEAGDSGEAIEAAWKAYHALPTGEAAGDLDLDATSVTVEEKK